MTIDINYFYLMTPMDRYEYMRLKLANLPEDLIQQYTLRDEVIKYGYVYLEIRQLMYGITQAGILAQKQSEKRLNAKVYKTKSTHPRVFDSRYASHIPHLMC